MACFKLVPSSISLRLSYLAKSSSNQAFKYLLRGCRTSMISSVNYSFQVPLTKPEKVLFRQFHSTRELSSEIVSFKLSDIGEGISEVTVKEWFVKVGDSVNQFDSICEVQSDKASVTITSRYDGIVKKIYYEVDDIAKVGQPLVDIEVESAEAEQIDQVTDQDANGPSSFHSSREEVLSSVSGKVLTTPAVRMLAMKNNINLTDVHGTGKDGRILKEDVLRFMNQEIKPAVSSVKVDSKEFALDKTKQRIQEKIQEATFEKYLFQDKTEPLKGIQRAMSKTMTQALKIPHFGLADEIEISQLIELLPIFRKAAEEKSIKMSFMPFFIKAASLALFQFPLINSKLDEKCENITLKASHNIGIAMDTKQGLIVPNIKNVQNLTLLEIAAELNRLQDLGQKGQLGTNDLTDGTFTISNIGSIGGSFGIPIIMPPEVAIGAIGKIKTVPKFDDDGNVIKSHVFQVLWSADHRVIDGATLCRFNNKWKSYIESPLVMLCEMK